MIGGNMKRVGLIISSPKTNAIWLSFNSAAAIGVGIRLAPGQLPFPINDDDFQDAIIEEIRAIAENAPETIGVLEFLR